MTDQKQKIISSKPVLTTKIFTVEEEKLVDHNNKNYTFYTAYSKPVASIIPYTDKGEIILLDQYRYMFEKRVIGIPSGVIEDGENALVTAKRELQEEAGIEARQWELLSTIAIARGFFHQMHSLFLAKDLEIGQNNPQDEEDIIVMRVPLQKAVEMVMTGEIFHSISMIGILMLDNLKREKKL